MGTFQRYRSLRRLIKPALQVLFGLFLIGGHALFFPVLLSLETRSELEVTLTTSDRIIEDPLAVKGRVPFDLLSRTKLLIDGIPKTEITKPLDTGLHRIEWSTFYQGGFFRRIGVSRFVGPFQDPRHPPCSARIYVNQSLLDDGYASYTTLAGVLKKTIEAQLENLEIIILGQFEDISHIAIWWSAAGAVSKASLSIEMTLSFEDGQVPISFVFIPEMKEGILRLLRTAQAKVQGESWFEKLAVYIADGDQMATEIAQQQIDMIGEFLESILQAPPPIPIGKGRFIRLAYCKKREIEITERGFAMLPLSVIPWEGETSFAPILVGTPNKSVPPSKAPIAFDLGTDAINGILQFLWASGYLQELVEEAQIEKQINQEKVIERLLSIQIKDLTLTFPPTVSWEETQQGKELSLGLEAAFSIQKSTKKTDRAKLFAQLMFSFSSLKNSRVSSDVSIQDLVLTCHPALEKLAPCYADLFEEFRQQPSLLEPPLSQFWSEYFTDLLQNIRLSSQDVPLQFSISEALISTPSSQNSSWIRIELFGNVMEMQ